MGNIRYSTFSDFTNYLGGLLNISYANMSTTQQTGVQSYFNFNTQKMWERCNWLETCPYGEARFVGNLGTYPNDLSKTTYWTATATTVTANNLSNPADGRVTASRLIETTGNSAHKVLETFTFIPSASYQVTCYFRPIAGRYLYLSANDGVNTYATFFSPAGVVGTSTSNLTQASTCVQANNGFWIATIYFTSATTAAAGTFGPATSTDGSTLSFVGSTSAGLYVWGNVINQTTYASPAAQVIPWDQTGEYFIEQVFNVWQQSPAGASYPATAPYEEVMDGTQILGTNGWSWNGWLYTAPNWYNGAYPVYLYYRREQPSYSGSAYSAMATYAVNDQILFTNSASVMDFWKCVVATSAGQSPDTTAASWERLQLPTVFLKFVTYASYGDYLRMDAQGEKAAAQADPIAEQMFLLEADKLERQSGWLPPFKVQTHVTSQPRGYGW